MALPPLKAVKRGAQSTPGSARPKSLPPLNREEGELPHDKGDQGTGGRRWIPRRRRWGRRGPKGQRGRSWPLGLLPLRGRLAKGAMTIRSRRAGPRGHLAWWPLRGPTGRGRPDPRLLQGRGEGKWPGAKTP